MNDPVASGTSSGTLARRHLRFGWWSLATFLTLGAVLETLHGFEVGWYLDASSATRRLMWTLAHAHGTLLSLVNVAFGMTVDWIGGTAPGRLRHASWCLVAAALLLPGGFFLGGALFYDGDPGLPIVLVPVGALLLAIAVAATARSLRR